MPDAAVVQLADRRVEHLGAGPAAEVVAEPDRARHQLQLEEVKVAAVVGVEQEAVRLRGPDTWMWLIYYI